MQEENHSFIVQSNIPCHYEFIMALLDVVVVVGIVNFVHVEDR